MINKESNRKLTAIMFADIVSYSRLMGSNEKEALKLLNDFDNISIPIIDNYKGIVIKNASILSRIPPCPGIKLPESFIDDLRL